MPSSSVMVLALCALGCFLVCGIPFGLIVTKALAGFDVRTQGSGNIGMTNVARSAGGKAAAITFVLDVGKGTVSMLVSRLVLAAFTGVGAEMLAFGEPLDWWCTILYVSCVFGHVFSPYLRFHGGKGISVGFGAALGLDWVVALVFLAVFLVVTIPSHFISAGSIAAAASLPIQGIIRHTTPASLALMVLASGVVIWSHRENIGRLLRHEERPFTIRHDDAKGS